MNYLKIVFIVVGVFVFMACSDNPVKTSIKNGDSIPLYKQITGVQPMTGMVLWEVLSNKDTDAIQLEYSYMRYKIGRAHV